jgi:hypothetical protein
MQGPDLDTRKFVLQETKGISSSSSSNGGRGRKRMDEGMSLTHGRRRKCDALFSVHVYRPSTHVFLFLKNIIIVLGGVGWAFTIALVQ